MKRFAKTVVKVLTEYSMVLQNDFHNHVRDEAKVISNQAYRDKWFIQIYLIDYIMIIVEKLNPLYIHTIVEMNRKILKS